MPDVYLFLVIGVLGALGLAALAVNIAVWLTPREVGGGLFMRVGTLLFDLGVAGLFLSSALLPSSGRFKYLEEPAPFWTAEAGITSALIVAGAGLIAFALGFVRSRHARPIVPPEARLHEQGPPPMLRG